MTECNHPPGFVQIVDHGLSVKCGACGVKRSLSRDAVKMLMAPKAGERAAGEMYGPTMADVVTQACRLNAACRSMGRAFWGQAKTPQQEQSLRLATKAIHGFTDMRPQLKAMLDMIVVSFGEAELAGEAAEDG